MRIATGTATAGDYGVFALVPQSHAGNPNTVKTSRAALDLCIDTTNHKLYFALSAGSTSWTLRTVSTLQRYSVEVSETYSGGYGYGGGSTTVPRGTYYYRSSNPPGFESTGATFVDCDGTTVNVVPEYGGDLGYGEPVLLGACP